jgi:hypothetical protein
MSFLDALIPGSVTYDLYVKSINCQTVNQGTVQLITPYTEDLTITGTQIANGVVTAIISGYSDFKTITLKEFTITGGAGAVNPGLLTLSTPAGFDDFDISGTIFYITQIAGQKVPVYINKGAGQGNPITISSGSPYLPSVTVGPDGLTPLTVNPRPDYMYGLIANQVYPFKGTTLTAIRTNYP